MAKAIGNRSTAQPERSNKELAVGCNSLVFLTSLSSQNAPFYVLGDRIPKILLGIETQMGIIVFLLHDEVNQLGN